MDHHLTEYFSQCDVSQNMRTYSASKRYLASDFFNLYNFSYKVGIQFPTTNMQILCVYVYIYIYYLKLFESNIKVIIKHNIHYKNKY